jgi:hypothetical protein
MAYGIGKIRVIALVIRKDDNRNKNTSYDTGYECSIDFVQS